MATASQGKRLGEEGGLPHPVIRLYDKRYSRSPRWEKLQEKVIVAGDQRGGIVEPSSKKCQRSPRRVPMQDQSKKFKQVEGKRRKRRHPTNSNPRAERKMNMFGQKKIPVFNDAQPHVAVPRNQLAHTMTLQGHHIPGKILPHYYAPLLPFWCLQTFIFRLVLVKRLSLQSVRLRGKKSSLGSLSINSTFRQLNCPLFFFSGAHHNL